jgi:hypothetical protein
MGGQQITEDFPAMLRDRDERIAALERENTELRRVMILMAEALEAEKEARLATGRQSTCDKQVHGDSHIECGKCFICLERKALAALKEGARIARAAP